MSTDALTWSDRARRVGFVAKGVVYGIVGAFALKVALGNGGAFLDKEGVVKKVLAQPYGQLLAGALGVGLLAYAVWRFTQALIDPRGNEGDGDAKRIAKRIAWAGSGLIHALLALTVFQTLTGADDDRKSWLARVLAEPGGKWLLVGAGLVVIGVGLFQLWQAYKASFKKKLDTAEMSAGERRWCIRIGRFGLVARGVVFPIIGWFLIQAGLRTDPAQAKGTAAALREIAVAPYGAYLLPIVAAGLLAYGLFMAFNARYSRPFM